jgi:hypothetical protein
LLQYRKPVCIAIDSPEDKGVILSVDADIKRIPRLCRSQTGGNGQAAFGIHCQDHGGIIPLKEGSVNRTTLANEIKIVYQTSGNAEAAFSNASLPTCV